MPATSKKNKYRHNVGLALFNKEGKVFMGKRIDTQTPESAWQMPQGGIDKGENIIQAALRELKEEVGTDKVEILHVAKEPVRYDLPEEIAKKLWDGQYAGQEQTWVALRFIGEDIDIDLSTFDHPEFSEWQWMSLKEACETVIYFRKEVYTKVEEMFRNIPKTLLDQKTTNA